MPITITTTFKVPTYTELRASARARTPLTATAWALFFMAGTTEDAYDTAKAQRGTDDELPYHVLRELLLQARAQQSVARENQVYQTVPRWVVSAVINGHPSWVSALTTEQHTLDAVRVTRLVWTTEYTMAKRLTFAERMAVMQLETRLGHTAVAVDVLDPEVEAWRHAVTR